MASFTREIDNVSFVYKECVSNFKQADLLIDNCTQLANGSNHTEQCAQFCSRFPETVPYVYLGISCLSAFCCLWVFVSFYSFPRLRQSGFSSKIFLLRTLMDLLIALGHIVSGSAKFVEGETLGQYWGCFFVGCLNEVALVASNLWYIVLAVDLIKAIRNPFSSRPSYGYFAHVMVWSFSLLLGVILALLTIPSSPGGSGPSMFYWCWISIENRKNSTPHLSPINEFAAVSLGLYYIWHFCFWIFSLFVVLAAVVILYRRLATSSETRKYVLKQNVWYVLVLGIETTLIIPLWATQLIIVRTTQDTDEQIPYFFTNSEYWIAIVYAVIHSLRGTVDLFVWIGAFSINLSDFKDLYKRLKSKNKDDICVIGKQNLKSPLITSKSDSTVNKALRRNAIYCINVGILDSVQLHMQNLGRIQRVGSVRDTFVAGQMMQHDEENQERERASLYLSNPTYREQSLRRIQFPASATLQSFSFIDLEPSIFSLLRTTYGVSPRNYRESFKIRNAADIDREGMLEKFTEGKSGSFFYFTRDYRYIIKTVTSEEENFLQKIANKYYNHMQNYPNSLIVRFFGLHKVRLAPEQRYITVVVMENIFNNKEKLQIQERYDLKGSWVGRKALKSDQERIAYKGCLKDLDLGHRKIVIGPENKSLLMEQLELDARFLQSCKIMDYSLLLGIHTHSQSGGVKRIEQTVRTSNGDDFVNVVVNKPKAPASKDMTSDYATDVSISEHLSPARVASIKSCASLTRERETTLSSTTQFRGTVSIPWFREDYGGIRSNSPFHPRYMEIGRCQSAFVENSESVPIATYYFGIVDILQQYNWRKKVEHMWKTRVQCQDKHGLSAVNENEYADRFLEGMDKIFQ